MLAHRRRLISTPMLTPVIVAAIALAVLIAVSLFLLADASNRQKETATERAVTVVQLGAREYERFIDDARERLRDVSRRPELGALGPQVCQTTLPDALRTVPGYLHAALAQPDGNTVCTTREDRAGARSLTSRPLSRSSAPQDAAFGHYAIESLTRHGVVNVVAPVRDAGDNIRAVVSVTLDLSVLALNMRDGGLPGGAYVVIVDGGGVVLSHSSGRAISIGEFLAQPVLKHLAARAPGTLDALELDGAPARLVFGPLARDAARFGDGNVIVVLPESALLKEAMRTAVRPFAAILVLLLIFVGLAWTLLDSSITKPTTILTEAMRRLGTDVGPGAHLPPRLVFEGARGGLRDALNAYEAVAWRLIQQEARMRSLEEELLHASHATPAPREAAISQPPARPASPVRRDPKAAVARREPVHAHWGLSEPAFENAPNPKFLYLSPGHEAVLRGVTYAVRQRRGCGLLIGKPGCGKTTLVRTLIQGLEAERYDVAFLLRPLREPLDLLREVLYELGVQTDEQRRSELLHLLGARFIHNARQHRETVIVLDEAQLAPARTLNELGLLLNYQSNERSLVTLLLVGSLELGERLSASGHLDGRLGVRCRIAPLDAEHTGKYVTHRLTVAGGAATIFTADALRLVHEMTDGIPRAINDLCENLLLMGSLNAVSQIDADTLRTMITPSARSNESPLTFDLSGTALAQHRNVDVR